VSQRLNYVEQSPEFFKKFVQFSTAIQGGSIEQQVNDLIEIRVSQMNGCAFCLDMHIKQAKIHGETELRLHHVAIWRESNLYTPRERAALAWAEVLTRLPEGGVPDDIYEHARGQFSEKEITDLTYLVMGINAWNRINVAFRNEPGSADQAFGLDKAGLS